MESRNRHRIVKYWKRGFVPFLLDPYCAHPTQCVVDRDSLVFQKAPPQFDPEPGVAHPRSTMYLRDHPILASRQRVGWERRRELDDYQVQ